MTDHQQTKRDIRRCEREQRRERRARTLREWRCWWTPPLRHAYGEDGRCVNCGAYPVINL